MHDQEYSLKNSLLETVKEGDVREKLEGLQGRFWEIKSASFEGWRDGTSWGFTGAEHNKRVRRGVKRRNCKQPNAAGGGNYLFKSSQGFEQGLTTQLISFLVSFETEVPVGSGSSGATAGVIDWTTYSFSQAVELTGLPVKFNVGIGFSRWHKRMKLWLTIKGLWPVMEYEKLVVDQEKADTVKAFAKWAEKDGVARMGCSNKHFV
ncbi:hypothetical protein AgCh_023083 [Apium graveolens]